MATNSTKRSYGQRTILTEGLAAVPSSPADISTVDSWIFQITVSNPTASGITYTVYDKHTVPLGLLNITVAANSTNVIPFSEGIKMVGGITWGAGGAGLVSEIFGFKTGS